MQRGCFEPAKRVIIPKGLVDPNETTIIEIPGVYADAVTVLATPKARHQQSAYYSIKRTSTTRVSAPIDEPIKKRPPLPPTSYQKYQRYRINPPNFEANPRYWDQNFVASNDFHPSYEQPLFVSRNAVNCKFVNPSFTDTSQSRDTGDSFTERPSITRVPPTNIYKKARTIISHASTTESQSTIIETIIEDENAPEMRPLHSRRSNMGPPKKSASHYTYRPHAECPTFSKSHHCSQSNSRKRHDYHVDRISETVGEQLAKIEAEERVMLQLDLIKYQNARRQLIQDATGINPNKFSDYEL